MEEYLKASDFSELVNTIKITEEPGFLIINPTLADKLWSLDDTPWKATYASDSTCNNSQVIYAISNSSSTILDTETWLREQEEKRIALIAASFGWPLEMVDFDRE